MWLVESYGPVVEVEALHPNPNPNPNPNLNPNPNPNPKQVEAFPGEGLHARCDPSYREKVLHLSGLGLGLRVKV